MWPVAVTVHLLDLPSVNLDTGLPKWSPMKDLNSNQTMAAAATKPAVRKPILRWSAARKRDVVLRLLRDESIETVSRQVAVEPYRLEQWRERALAALEARLKDRAEDDPVQAALGAAYKRLGELGMENELLRETRPTPHNNLPRILSRIGSSARQPNAHTWRRRDHPRSTPSTRRSAGSSTSAFTRTDVPSASTISITPARPAAGPAIGPVRRGDSAATSTRRNAVFRPAGVSTVGGAMYRADRCRFHAYARARQRRHAATGSPQRSPASGPTTSGGAQPGDPFDARPGSTHTSARIGFHCRVVHWCIAPVHQHDVRKSWDGDGNNVEWPQRLRSNSSGVAEPFAQLGLLFAKPIQRTSNTQPVGSWRQQRPAPSNHALEGRSNRVVPSCWPPSSASRLNQICRDSGIVLQSRLASSRSSRAL
jgi:transposase